MAVTVSAVTEALPCLVMTKLCCVHSCNPQESVVARWLLLLPMEAFSSPKAGFNAVS